jgi:hypothetical protein
MVRARPEEAEARREWHLRGFGSPQRGRIIDAIYSEKEAPRKPSSGFFSLEPCEVALRFRFRGSRVLLSTAPKPRLRSQTCATQSSVGAAFRTRASFRLLIHPEGRFASASVRWQLLILRLGSLTLIRATLRLFRRLVGAVARSKDYFWACGTPAGQLFIPIHS